MTMSMIFPNESPAYREARRELLAREVALRRGMEAVAAEIRALPPGGEIRRIMSSITSALTARPRRCDCPSCFARAPTL